MKLTFGLVVVLFLFGISLLAGAITGNQLYYRLSYIWLFLVIVSWVMSRIALKGVKFRRTARSLRSQVGYVFEERFELQNFSRIPRLWIEVRDEASLPGSSGSHVLTMIGGRESRSYLARTRLQERGVFQLGPTDLISGDIFGLFPVRHRFTDQEVLLVYPMMFEVHSFPNPPGLLPGGEALRRRTPQITSNAAGVREYSTGDPLNRIHWASTARRGRLIVKEFELDPLAEVWIFIDAASASQVARHFTKAAYDPQDFWKKKPSYELPPSSIEYSVSIGASLARYYLQRGRAVGLVSAGQFLQVLPADRGGRQLGKILEALALLRPEGTIPLDGLVDTQARHLPRGSTAVLITTSTSKQIFQTADILLRRGFRPVAILLDSTSFGGYFKPDEAIASMQFLGIPACRVAYGDNLSATISSVVVSPQLKIRLDN